MCDANDTCRAKRNGRVQSYNEVVTPAQTQAYVYGKNATLLAASLLVGPKGSFFAKATSYTEPPPYGGNLNFAPMDLLNASEFITNMKIGLQYYKYLIAGRANDFHNPLNNGTSATCTPDSAAKFLMGVEPGRCHSRLDHCVRSQLFSPPLRRPYVYIFYQCGFYTVNTCRDHTDGRVCLNGPLIVVSYCAMYLLAMSLTQIGKCPDTLCTHPHELMSELIRVDSKIHKIALPGRRLKLARKQQTIGNVCVRGCEVIPGTPRSSALC